jgi:hypothetical protein
VRWFHLGTYTRHVTSNSSQSIATDTMPCDGCEFVAACRRSGHECTAFRSWVGSGVAPGWWTREQRHPTKPVRLTRLSAPSPAESEHAPRRAPLDRQIERQMDQKTIARAVKVILMNRARKLSALARRLAQWREHAVIASSTIDGSGRASIASSAPLYARYASQSATKDNLTFRQSMDEHAREYLTRVLTATDGDRVTAATLSGLNRTHLHSLIKRHKVDLAPNLKSRGRRRSKPAQSIGI